MERIGAQVPGTGSARANRLPYAAIHAGSCNDRRHHGRLRLVLPPARHRRLPQARHPVQGHHAAARPRRGFPRAITAMADRWRDQKLDAVVGIESRGFILGAAMALELGWASCRCASRASCPARCCARNTRSNTAATASRCMPMRCRPARAWRSSTMCWPPAYAGRRIVAGAPPGCGCGRCRRAGRAGRPGWPRALGSGPAAAHRTGVLIKRWVPTGVGIHPGEWPGAGRCQPWLATRLQSHHPHAEATALDLAGLQPGHGLVGLLARDRHIGTGREDRDLADELG